VESATSDEGVAAAKLGGSISVQVETPGGGSSLHQSHGLKCCVERLYSTDEVATRFHLLQCMRRLMARVEGCERPLVARGRPPAIADGHLLYSSICSAILSASSTSTPRYRTVLSSFV
jgi:hypothetical protein